MRCLRHGSRKTSGFSMSYEVEPGYWCAALRIRHIIAASSRRTSVSWAMSCTARTVRRRTQAASSKTELKSSTNIRMSKPYYWRKIAAVDRAAVRVALKGRNPVLFSVVKEHVEISRRVTQEAQHHGYLSAVVNTVGGGMLHQFT
jgi:hypothetical protein